MDEPTAYLDPTRDPDSNTSVSDPLRGIFYGMAFGLIGWMALAALFSIS